MSRLKRSTAVTPANRLVTASKRTSGRAFGSAQGAKSRLIGSPAPAAAASGLPFPVNNREKTGRRVSQFSYNHSERIPTRCRSPNCPALWIARGGDQPHPLRHLSPLRRADKNVRGVIPAIAGRLTQAYSRGRQDFQPANQR